MKSSKAVRSFAVLVLAALAGAGFGAYSRNVSAHTVSDVRPIPVYDMEPTTIVEAPTAAPEVIEMAPITIVGRANRVSAPRSVKAPKAAHKATSAGTRFDLVELDQGGRPGATMVLAWGI